VQHLVDESSFMLVLNLAIYLQSFWLCCPYAFTEMAQALISELEKEIQLPQDVKAKLCGE
jgi:hypothetical protein